MSEHRDVGVSKSIGTAGRSKVPRRGGVLSVRRLCQMALFAGCLAQPSLGFGAETVITRVEEDWVLEVGTPNPDEIAPQVFVVMSPTDNLNGLHSVFEINNLSLPNFYGGGLQLQMWDGDFNAAEAHHNSFAALGEPGEQITFTVQMRLWESLLRFKILNGQSNTWGTFGTDDNFKVNRSCDLPNLNSYSPAKSAEYSRVGFAGHRVAKLALKEVRYYSYGVLVNTDTTERVVHVHE